MSKAFYLGFGKLDRNMLTISLFFFEFSFVMAEVVFADAILVGFQSLRSSSKLVWLLGTLEANGNFLMIFFFIYTSGVLCYVAYGFESVFRVDPLSTDC